MKREARFTFRRRTYEYTERLFMRVLAAERMIEKKVQAGAKDQTEELIVWDVNGDRARYKLTANSVQTLLEKLSRCAKRMDRALAKMDQEDEA